MDVQGMYTYAFLLHPSVPLELPPGIAGPLHLIHSHHLSALVEAELDFDRLQQSDNQLMQAVLLHDRVIRLMFQQTDLLPLRFGTRFVSEAGLLEHLESQSPHYLKKLHQLTGKAEYTVRFEPLALSDSEIASNLKGKDYFLAKKQRYQAQFEYQHHQQVELNQVKEMINQTYTWSANESPEGTERIHLLVDRKEESVLAQNLQYWQQTSPNWVISLSEALPPYHFMS
jgi:hypothetical protein